MGPLSAGDLAALGRFERSEIDQSLERLAVSGLLEREDGPSEPTFRARHFFVPVGAATGWEAAVFDHFHAVVRTICAKLRQTTESSPTDETGGSTYSFEIWKDHPMADEVLGTLRRFREVQSALRERVREYNSSHSKPGERLGVVVYAGQTVWDREDGKDDEHAENVLGDRNFGSFCVGFE